MPETSQMHLLDYWQIIKSRLPILVTTFLVVVGVVAVYSFVRTPIFRAQCRMLIQPTQLRLSKVEEVYDPTVSARDVQGRRDFQQTQVEIIQSDRILTKVFEQFKFGEMPEFRDELQKIKAFRRLVGVDPIRNTFLVDVSFEWRDAELAAQVANYISKLYVKDYSERQQGLSGTGLEKLREYLVQLQQARQDALRELAAFKAKNRIINLDDAQKILVTRITDLSKALVEAQVEETISRVKTSLLDQLIREGGDISKLPEVLDSQSLREFKLEQLKAQAQLMELVTKLGPSSPTVATQDKIVKSVMGKAVDEESRKIAESVRLQQRRDQLRVGLLQQEIEAQEKRAFSLDEVGGMYRILDDALKATEETYRLVLKRISELEITEKTGEVEAGGNIMIIDNAQPPERHAYPRKGLNIILAAVIGLLLGGALCLFLDYLDATVKSKEEVEGMLGAPVLGYIPPPEGGADEMSALQSSMSGVAENFRTIRTGMGLSLYGRKHRVFVVTSSVPGEGKTFAALNLAIAFARDGKRVLLIEADMRRPRLRKVFAPDLKNKGTQGLANVLVEADTLASAIWNHPALPALSVLFCGPIPPNPAELLGSGRFSGLIKEAAEKHDVVILDAPPLLNVADSTILAGLGLPLVYVVRTFHTERGQIKHAADLLRTVQGKIIGAIINAIDVPSQSRSGGFYGYGRQYYYYHDGNYRSGKE